MKYLVKAVYVKSLLVHYVVEARNTEQATNKALEGKYLFAHHCESDTEPQVAQASEINDSEIDQLIASLEASDEPAPISERFN